MSLNPGGRPKSLVRRTREETRDGEELISYMLEAWGAKVGRHAAAVS